MVVPRNLNDSTASRVLFMMVSGGSAGLFLLKSTIISTVLSVFSSRLLTAPEPFNPQSVSRLVTFSDETDDSGVVGKFQELDRGVFRSAVVNVQGEEQWGENALLGGAIAGVRVLDVSFPSLTRCCRSIRKLEIY